LTTLKSLVSSWERWRVAVRLYGRIKTRI